MSELFREVCYRCRRAQRVCLCGAIEPIAPAAKVVFLQHPREARNVVGTTRIAHLALAGSRLFQGVDFTDDAHVMRALADEAAHSAVVYPGPGARPAEELAAREGPLTLWIIDGTWSQARKIWKQNPWLQRLPAYRLAPEAPGNYRIRKEPAAHCLATIEATAQILDVVAGERGRHAGLIRAFDTMVERQLGFAHSGGGRKRIRRAKKPRTLQAPADFTPQKAVLIHAEGNGWPTRSDKHRLLELRLERVATGEVRRWIVRSDVPPHAIALGQLGLSDVDPALSPAELGEAIADFVSEDAWCVGYGQYTPALLTPLASLPRFFDLKPALVDFSKRRLGYVDDAIERLALGPLPATTSRGERRAAALRRIFNAYLVDSSCAIAP